MTLNRNYIEGSRFLHQIQLLKLRDDELSAEINSDVCYLSTDIQQAFVKLLDFADFTIDSVQPLSVLLSDLPAVDFKKFKIPAISSLNSVMNYFKVNNGIKSSNDSFRQLLENNKLASMNEAESLLMMVPGNPATEKAILFLNEYYKLNNRNDVVEDVSDGRTNHELYSDDTSIIQKDSCHNSEKFVQHIEEYTSILGMIPSLDGVSFLTTRKTSKDNNFDDREINNLPLLPNSANDSNMIAKENQVFKKDYSPIGESCNHSHIKSTTNNLFAVEDTIIFLEQLKSSHTNYFITRKENTHTTLTTSYEPIISVKEPLPTFKQQGNIDASLICMKDAFDYSLIMIDHFNSIQYTRNMFIQSFLANQEEVRTELDNNFHILLQTFDVENYLQLVENQYLSRLLDKNKDNSHSYSPRNNSESLSSLSIKQEVNGLYDSSGTIAFLSLMTDCLMTSEFDEYFPPLLATKISGSSGIGNDLSLSHSSNTSLLHCIKPVYGKNKGDPSSMIEVVVNQKKKRKFTQSLSPNVVREEMKKKKSQFDVTNTCDESYITNEVISVPELDVFPMNSNSLKVDRIIREHICPHCKALKKGHSCPILTIMSLPESEIV